MEKPQEDLYSPAQVEAYLEHVLFFKQKSAWINAAVFKPEPTLEYLSILQRCQLATVPFENLSLHYSKHPSISLDKDDLYEKIVINKRGGYCMENNYFFMIMLKSLGFQAITTGARVYEPGGGRTGWSHQVILVGFPGCIYLVDVGFGGACPTRPLLLEHEHSGNWGMTKAAHRILYKKSSNSMVKPLWVLQHRISDTHDWRPLFEFGMMEFTPKDFDVMNFATSTRNTSFFTYKILCMKAILDEDVGDIVGTVVLEGARLKRRIRAETEELMQCQSEEQRIEALQKYFGIVLTLSEIEGIKGTVTQLPAQK